MKGANHLVLTLLTLFLILSPFAGFFKSYYIPALIIIILGVFIGSLTPDIDKGRESAIFHSSIPGFHGKRFIVTPIFGYVIYYTCYMPIRAVFVMLFGKKIYAKSGHRELPHSPIGILFISALLTFYIWMICFALSFIPNLSFIYNNIYIWIFGASFLFGCFMHLIEDTCDKSGIHYFYPFRFSRLRGKITGDGTDIRPRVYEIILLISAIAVMTASLTGIFKSIIYAQTASAALPVIFWIIFMKASGVPAKRDASVSF
ncbi:MAG TPA: metal-dependent hydrolase [Methanocorpusculum sp.]|nr:metal-dependent hydrolase [Methanocorpusculum sp.]